MSLPTLFVAGAPKCGTTSLHDWLGQHPAVHMSRRKEPKYWLFPEQRPSWTGPGDHIAAGLVTCDRADYEALFDERGDAVHAGESSPYYLWDSEAQRRIRAEIPHAKFIVLLRRPEERALSNWGHNWQDGRETLDDLTAAVEAEPERRERGWEPFWFYESLGRYGQQMESLLSYFPAEQVHVELFDDLARDPQAMVARIFQFLEVDPIEVNFERKNATTYYAASRHARLLQRIKHQAGARADRIPAALRHRGRGLLERAMSRTASEPPKLDAVTARRLRARFADDLERLGDLGVDVTRWRLAD